MPNHIHFILFLDAPEQTRDYSPAFGPRLKGSLDIIVSNFKAGITREIGRLRGGRTSVWQARFHDRIIRDEFELMRIRQYIHENPVNWVNDRCHPDHPDFESVWRDGSPDPDVFGGG